MSKKGIANFLLFFILIVLNLFVVLKVIAREHKTAAMNSILDEIDTAILADSGFTEEFFVGPESNLRVAKLKSFFRKYSSPLFDSAEHIVAVSDENDLDYRLIPAIAMQESTLCKFIPVNSHNCWGWGIYGNTVTRFDSYDEAISTVARGLKKNYIDKGHTTTAEIMAIYTPSSNGSWARGVNTVLGWLE